MGYLVTRRLFREASIYLASCVLCFLPSFSLFLSYTLLISSESLAVVQVQISRPGEGEALCKALQLIAHTKSSPIPDVSIKQSPAGHLSLTFLRCNVTAVTHEREREQRKTKKRNETNSKEGYRFLDDNYPLGFIRHVSVRACMRPCGLFVPLCVYTEERSRIVEYSGAIPLQRNDETIRFGLLRTTLENTWEQ